MSGTEFWTVLMMAIFAWVFFRYGLGVLKAVGFIFGFAALFLLVQYTIGWPAVANGVTVAMTTLGDVAQSVSRAFNNLGS